MSDNHIIFLNGTSSSGKSTLGTELRRIADTNYSLLSADLFWQSVEHDRFDSHDFFATLHKGLFAAALELYKCGVGLILDVVLQEDVDLQNAIKYLKDCRVFFVGVHCDLPVLEQRELDRGDRQVGTAKYQFDRVHRHGIYDIELSSAQESPESMASQVIDLVKVRTPSAFSESALYFDKSDI